MKIIGSDIDKRIFSELLQQFSPEEEINQGEEIIIEHDEDSITVKNKELVKTLKLPVNYIPLINNELERRVFYDFLKSYYNKTLDWGLLTGVKPVKLYRKALRNNFDVEDLFLNKFELKLEKFELLKTINDIQEPVLDSINDNHISIYVGIPICPQKCSYCSFVSTVLDKNRVLLKNYLEALEYEIVKTGEFLKDKDLIIDSIYIGGGTPSVLNVIELKRLIDLLKENLNLKNLKEFTFEAGRSDTIDKNFLEVLKEEGITRICLNPQSMNKDTLESVNRFIDPDDIKNNYKLMRKLGFNNINMDLICGIDETEEKFLNSLKEVIKLSPENITIHDLSLKKGSRLKELKGKNTDNNFSKEFFNYIINYLKEENYKPYYMYRQKYTINNGENIGYTKNNFESFYNISMMAEEQSIIGIGAGSSGKLYEKDLDRFSHVFTVKDIKTYNERYKEIVDRKIKDYESFYNRRLDENSI